MYAGKRQYLLRLQLEDSSGASGTGYLWVNVGDVREAPAFSPDTPATVHIHEGFSGTSSIIFNATDEDFNSFVTYSLRNAYENLAIDVATGRIDVLLPFDFDFCFLSIRSEIVFCLLLLFLFPNRSLLLRVLIEHQRGDRTHKA